LQALLLMLTDTRFYNDVGTHIFFVIDKFNFESGFR